MVKILAWTSFGCTVLFAVMAVAAVFAGESLGIPGVPLLYASVAVAVIGVLAAIAAVVLGQFD